MSAEIGGIEHALDALLTAMTEDQARQPEAPVAGVMATPFDMRGPVPTRAEMEMTQLLRQPVSSACRMGVRRLGAQAFAVTGSTDGMREIADRVADMAPAEAGRRLAMMNSAWDGVGTNVDRWWA